MTDLLSVNQDLCTSCGLCARDCPTKVIELQDGTPTAVKDLCIACGHCVSVCPTGAMDNRLSPLANQLPKNKALDISSEQAGQFLRARRSTRSYQDHPVEKEKLTALLEMGRFAPTAENSQGISWLIIQNKETLRKIAKATGEYMISFMATRGPEQAKAAKDTFSHNEVEMLLRSAPCLAFPLAQKDNPFAGRDSAVITMTYCQLYAPTIGLGTCWAGFVEAALRAKYSPLLALLKVPEDKEISGAMMIGVPQYQHQRLPDRNPLEIIWQA